MPYTERTVTDQAELDKALADKVNYIRIESPSGVWLNITDSGSSRVEAWGSSSVEAWGSSRVEAWGSSHVVARGSSHVVARGSSHVEAWESSHVEARGSSHVEARESSHVEAWGSSHVEARGSSHVEARESSHVLARESSHVEASKYVAVHLHSGNVDVKGGVIIDLTKIDLTDARQWCEYHGVKVDRGIATLYKAVNDQWTTERGTNYSPGTKPSCDDWSDTDSCGGGLHFGPTPGHALAYQPDATKFVAVGVRLSELRPISGGTAKAKAPRVARACVEVDRFGDVVEAAS